MKVKITNDKKERYQSFEAEGEISINTGFGYLSFNAVGYGATEDEAIDSLRKIIHSPNFNVKCFDIGTNK